MPASLVGILNVTPDSFSDGGQYLDVDAAYDAAAAMLREGAEVIDIGAESTRPGATPLTPEEEWQRLSKLLPKLRDTFPEAILSVDTRYVPTADKALAVGVDWINDVSGAMDPAMQTLIATHPHAKLVVMHSLSIPADPQQVMPEEKDPVMVMEAWFAERLETLLDAGIQEEQVIFDPGIGFGKTAEQSWALLREVKRLRKAAKAPLFIGHSRKSFLKTLTGASAAERDVETCALTVWLALQGVEYLRVHDVAGNARALQAIAALGA